MKPPKIDRIGTGCLVLVKRLVPSQRFPSNSLDVTIIHHTMTEHKNNHVTVELHNDYESICLAFSTSCGPIGKIFFEVEHTNHTGLH